MQGLPGRRKVGMSPKQAMAARPGSLAGLKPVCCQASSMRFVLQVVVAQARDCIHLPKIDKKSTEAPGGAKASKGGSRTGPAQAQAKHDATAEEEPASNTESSEEMPEEAIAAAREAALEKLGKPLEKMKIKELLALLTERGVECKNCRGAEKSHIIGQVRDAIHLPKNTKKAEDKKRNAAKARSGREGGKDEGVEDILAKMKGMPGMENIKVFGRDDIDKMMKDGNWGGTRDDL